MKVISTTKELKKFLPSQLDSNTTIGLVPTMGALHQGHIKLVEKSTELCDLTVVSIFVNPAQFNNLDDLAKYPKALDKDLHLLKPTDCDVVFTPSVAEMYSGGQEIKLDFGSIEFVLEGKHRPGHFQGVGLIVSKFFKIVQPTHAFFGQKDLQQYHIVQRLIEAYGFLVNLIQVPIIRENNGLAMSSRNSRLSHEEKEDASVIYGSLQKSKEQLLKGEKIDTVKQRVSSIFKDQKGMALEYFEMVETRNFSSVSTLDHDEVALCIAVNVSDVRLIDNILLFS